MKLLLQMVFLTRRLSAARILPGFRSLSDCPPPAPAVTAHTEAYIPALAQIRIRRRKTVLPASFTVEAALLMTVILPVLLAIIYYGFFLHDKGVLNGAAQQITAQADLNSWKSSGNNNLGKKAKKLEKQARPSKNVSSSVSVTKDQASVSYTGSMSLPGILPSLFGKSRLNTGASASRKILYPADLIRKIRGFEYVSALLKGG